MIENNHTAQYERRVTGAERFFSHAPFSTVTMVARIKGSVNEEMLRDAVRKVQQRHALLQVRIKADNRDLWFTSEAVGEIPIEVVPRKSDGDWIKVHAEGAKIPYDFETRPAIRFILVQSEELSELIILCHHIICDGLPLAFLARDLMNHLGDPTAEAAFLPAPEPISLENLPADAAPSGLIKFFISRIKQKWDEAYVRFDQEDYAALNKAYWQQFSHEIIAVELSESETTALVQRCREEHVTVNTALITAFLGAQRLVGGDPQPHQARTAVAVSLRDRLPNPPGEGMGYYALGLQIEYKYNPKKSFWENARNYHKKVGKNISNRKAFGDLPSYLAMDSNIYEALSFKKLGGFVQPDSPSYPKLSDFSERDDMVVGLLKRAKIETLDSKLLGPAITNLGRLDFPKTYGALELERLIMQPGGAFPLVHVDMVIGAVTCAGKLSIVVEFAEQAVERQTMQKLTDKAVALLFE